MFDWLISGYPSLFVLLYAWLLIAHWEIWYDYLWCMFGYCVHLKHWQLIILIDPLACPHILSFLAVWLLCSPWLVYSHCCLSHHHGILIFFCYVLSRSPLSMLFIFIGYPSHLSRFLLRLLIDLDYIYLFCMTAWCMIALLLCDACVACLCEALTYPHISNSLVLVELVSLDLIFHMRLVALFALRPR